MYKNKPFDYEKLGVAPPTQINHEDFVKIVPTGPWKQRGNHIYREGEGAYFASKIPTSHILAGTDDNGNPILQKINH